MIVNDRIRYNGRRKEDENKRACIFFSFMLRYFCDVKPNNIVLAGGHFVKKCSLNNNFPVKREMVLRRGKKRGIFCVSLCGALFLLPFNTSFSTVHAYMGKKLLLFLFYALLWNR